MLELDDILRDVDHSWKTVLKNSFRAFDKEYLHYILNDNQFFPNRDNFLNAFKSLSLEKTKYILFGQDPYPRYESAIGYAFIDGRVKEIFSETGLSKEINRATSLRNFIKMLLLCENLINQKDMSQNAIAKINKTSLCSNILCLKNNFEKNGVLLLNMSLVFSSKNESKYHIKKWRVFVEKFLKEIDDRNITLILFGSAAKEINKFHISEYFEKKAFLHPYNISFIQDDEVHKLFKPMNLLRV